MPEEYTTLEASDGIRDTTEGSRRRGKPDKGELSLYTLYTVKKYYVPITIAIVI